MGEIITLWCDGSSIGNPGPSGAGVFYLKEQEPIAEFGVFIGKKTNNEAEYLAVFYGMRFALNELQATQIEIHSDSMLVINQLTNRYKVTNQRLVRYKNRIETLGRRFREWSIVYHHWSDDQPPHRLAQWASRTQMDYVHIFNGAIK